MDQIDVSNFNEIYLKVLQGMGKKGSRLGLDNPVERIMSAGGDERIRIDERTGLNKYGCAPYPRNSLAYASSTASSISASAFEHVNSLHYQLLKETKNVNEITIYEKRFHKIRERLRLIYGIDKDIDIAFGPSGTDLELAVLAFSLLSIEQKVNNIIIGINEVGSGAEYAAAGEHFAEHTALDSVVDVGAKLQGFDHKNVKLSKIYIRDQLGKPRKSLEIFDEIEEQIHKAIDRGARPLIHVVHRSKTGLILPKWKEFKRLVDKWGESIDIVVDACQGRISPNEVNNYLKYGASVLLTGSKFFGGAPFSGVALIPQQISNRLKSDQEVSKGLNKYFTRAEWPEDWNCVNNILPRETNFGLLFRWESALYEMQRLMAVSTKNLNKVIESFIKAAVDNFAESTDVKLDEGFQEFKDYERLSSNTPLDKNTIITLLFDNKVDDLGAIDLKNAKQIHQYLYKDLRSISEGIDHQISSLICHLGQPVECEKWRNGRWKGTLRLALSAPQVYELAFLDKKTIHGRFSIDFKRIREKINFIINNYERINSKSIYKGIL